MCPSSQYLIKTIVLQSRAIPTTHAGHIKALKYLYSGQDKYLYSEWLNRLNMYKKYYYHSQNDNIIGN